MSAVAAARGRESTEGVATTPFDTLRSRVLPRRVPVETRWRTLVRSLVWRVTGIALAVLLTFLFTRDWRLGVELGITYNAIRLVMHYMVDRVWAHVQWGLNGHLQ